MIPLQTQEMLEVMLGRRTPENNEPIVSFAVIYFTANWCGACKNLDLGKITNSLPKATWFKCDVDENEYSPGFCQIKSIPSFLVIKDKKVLGLLSNSDNDKVINWLMNFHS